MKWTCLLALMIACGGTRAPEPMREPSRRRRLIPVPVEEIAGRARPSIYDLPVALQDAAGHEIGLDIARGHPVLISMFYASCSVACRSCSMRSRRPPRATRRRRDDLRIVFVSFDAARDTQAAASSPGRAGSMTGGSSPPPASPMRALAALIDFTYRKLDNGSTSTAPRSSRSTVLAGRSRADNLGKRASLPRRCALSSRSDRDGRTIPRGSCTIGPCC
jgi:protein SCO1/2